MPRYDYNTCVNNRMTLGCACAACQDLGTLAGLGDSSATEYLGPAAMAANFIPGVGQIISAVLAVAGPLLDKLFGWGDPNSMDDLFKVIVQMRAALAQVHQTMGLPDDWKVPFGFDVSEHEMANLAMFTINELEHKASSVTDTMWADIPWDAAHYDAVHTLSTKVWPAYQGSDERKSAYTAITMLKSLLQNAQLAATGAQLSAPADPLPGGTPPVLPPTATPPVPPTDPNAAPAYPTQETTPAPVQAGLTFPMVAMMAGGVLLLLTVTK